LSIIHIQDFTPIIKRPEPWPASSPEEAAENRARYLEACIWLDADERISKGQSEIEVFCELRKLYPDVSRDDITAPLAAVMRSHGRRSIMKDWLSESPFLTRLREIKRERRERQQ
jgi:hypothetical protein